MLSFVEMASAVLCSAVPAVVRASAIAARCVGVCGSPRRPSPNPAACYFLDTGERTSKNTHTSWTIRAIGKREVLQYDR